MSENNAGHTRKINEKKDVKIVFLITLDITQINTDPTIHVADLISESIRQYWASEILPNPE